MSHEKQHGAEIDQNEQTNGNTSTPTNYALYDHVMQEPPKVIVQAHQGGGVMGFEANKRAKTSGEMSLASKPAVVHGDMEKQLVTNA